MIKVIYELKDDKYHSIYVSGHAQFEDKGKDLICAAVSSIMFGFMNALDELNEDVDIKQKTNEICIINNSSLDVVENYFELVMMQLKTIEKSYDEFIRIERK